MLVSHAAEPGLISDSGRILTWASLVDSCQYNVTSTIMERLAFSNSSLNVCSSYEDGDKCQFLRASQLYTKLGVEDLLIHCVLFFFI